MSLDRADRSFIRRALADAVDEIVKAITDVIDDAVAEITEADAIDDTSAAADDPDDASAPDADDSSTPDGDPDAAAEPDDGHVAVPTHAVAGVARLARGTRCVITGGVTSLQGNTAQGHASFFLLDAFDPEATVRVIVPHHYSAEFARHVRDGAIVAVDGIVDRPARVIAMIVRVLAAPPPQRTPVVAPGPKPAVVPEPALPSAKPSTPPCWPVPAVISCRVGCGSDAPQWERRPATKYYVYVNANSVYAQCTLHGNWLKTDGKTIQRTDIPVYMISAPPVPGATRLRCDVCGPLCDTWLVAEDADGRPRLYCSGTTFVDGEHRPLHAYHINVGVSGGVALVPIYPGDAGQAAQTVSDA